MQTMITFVGSGSFATLGDDTLQATVVFELIEDGTDKGQFIASVKHCNQGSRRPLRQGRDRQQLRSV